MEVIDAIYNGKPENKESGPSEKTTTKKKKQQGQKMKEELKNLMLGSFEFKCWFDKLKKLKDQIYSKNNIVKALWLPDKLYSHPKIRVIQQRLNSLLMKNPDAQVLIFCPLRSIAISLYKDLLLMDQNYATNGSSAAGPTKLSVRPALLLGKASGGLSKSEAKDQDQDNLHIVTNADQCQENLPLTVKEMDKQLEQFREGQLNVACATCVAEEGLDIGKIDMIIMYDIFHNKTRFTQRIGRCGRKKAGICVLLATEDTIEAETTRKHVRDYNQKFEKSYSPIVNQWLRSGLVTCVDKSYSQQFIPKIFFDQLTGTSNNIQNGNHPSNQNIHHFFQKNLAKKSTIRFERKLIDFAEDPEIDVSNLKDYYKEKMPSKKLTSSSKKRKSMQVVDEEQEKNDDTRSISHLLPENFEKKISLTTKQQNIKDNLLNQIMTIRSNKVPSIFKQDNMNGPEKNRLLTEKLCLAILEKDPLNNKARSHLRAQQILAKLN